MRRKRKSLIRRHTLSVILLGLLGAQDVLAVEEGDTVVNFSGSLVARACNIASGSLTQDVEFGSVPVKSFINDGTTVPVPFNLALTDCKTGGTVRVSFSSDQGRDTQVPDAFALNGNNTVALRLESRDESQSVIAPETQSAETTIDTTDLTLPFQARLVTADASKVVAGEFSLPVTATFEYD